MEGRQAQQERLHLRFPVLHVSDHRVRSHHPRRFESEHQRLVLPLVDRSVEGEAAVLDTEQLLKVRDLDVHLGGDLGQRWLALELVAQSADHGAQSSEAIRIGSLHAHLMP